MIVDILLTAALAHTAVAFPFVLDQPGVNAGLIRRQQPPNPGGPGSAATCPNNPNHVPAAPITKQYPYNGAINGSQGTGKGGYLVPAPGDTAHQFIAPDYTKDIRGPCPGLNTAANHGFLARDGIVTYNELVDAQQNVYNVGYDLANLLATLGLITGDGDIVNQKLSIGCDATTRTSFNATATGSEPGLDGHDKFEADTSLTRNDFFLANGDNYKFNGTLFGMMTKTTGANYNLPNLALYRAQRYNQSRADNPNFYFGPFSLLLYGAASFLYELMPSENNNFAPDYATISSFFGAKKNSDGTYSFNGQERIPPNWTVRNTPYDIPKVGSQIFQMYQMYPVQFGGNTGNGTFDLLFGYNGFDAGRLNASTPQQVSCLLYQLATERTPASLNGVISPTVAALQFAATKLNPIFKNLGCPIALT